MIRSYDRRTPSRYIGLAIGQGLLLTIAAIIFALLPAQNAPVLALPLRAESAASLIGAQTRLLGAGRLRGSIVIVGAHPPFWTALIRDSILILPALPILCGSDTSPESSAKWNS
jgi:hypothetical protein